MARPDRGARLPGHLPGRTRLEQQAVQGRSTIGRSRRRHRPAERIPLRRDHHPHPSPSVHPPAGHRRRGRPDRDQGSGIRSHLLHHPDHLRERVDVLPAARSRPPAASGGNPQNLSDLLPLRQHQRHQLRQGFSRRLPAARRGTDAAWRPQHPRNLHHLSARGLGAHQHLRRGNRLPRRAARGQRRVHRFAQSPSMRPSSWPKSSGEFSRSSEQLSRSRGDRWLS